MLKDQIEKKIEYLSKQDKFERARKLTLSEKYKLKKEFPKLGGRNENKL